MASDLPAPYDQIVALLPHLTIDELAQLELEVRRRIMRDPDGDMAQKRAAINSLPSFDDWANEK